MILTTAITMYGQIPRPLTTISGSSKRTAHAMNIDGFPDATGKRIGAGATIITEQAQHKEVDPTARPTIRLPKGSE
jgi:hypothetical protein